MTQKGKDAPRCQQCGTVVSTSWHLPTSCKECGASFDPRPRWIPSAVLVGAAALAIVVVALVRLATTSTAALVTAFVVACFVMFNALQLLLFKLGVYRLTNVNAVDELAESIRLADSDALAKAEGQTRAKNYAGSSKETRTAQAKQLKESLELAKSLRTNTATPQDAAPTRDEAGSRTLQTGASAGSSAGSTEPRCRFGRVTSANEAGIRRMSALATRIVREHFDPIVGPEQNDYMIERFQSPEAIARQIEEGYEYYFVLPPKEPQPNDGARKGVRPLGFLALRAEDEGILYLSKFYLVKDERGKGYAHPMMRFVTQRARKLGCDRVMLRVNRNNYQAILAYEHLGFVRIGELCSDIGNGYVMDDFVYQFDL